MKLAALMLLGWAITPQQQNADLEAAKRLIAGGSTTEAVEILRGLVTADPKNADAILLLGTALALVPKRTDALDALHRAIELRPDSAQGYLILGNILARFSEPADARKAYEKALALDPRLGMAHANLAILLAFGREFSAAADHFSRAIDLAGDPADRARYYYLRGRIYRQQDSPLEAAKDFEQAIKLRPNYEEAYLELGMTRADLGNDAGALPAFEKAVSLAPEDAGARYQLGTAYLRAGQPQAAAEHLRAAARMQPDDRDTLYALVRALRASGRTEEAEPLMQRLAEEAQRQALHEPDILKAGELNNAGIALEKQGNYTAALEKYRAALQISPQEISFRKNLALALCRLERWREAVAELEKVLQAAPGDPDATKALYIALDKTDGRSK